MIALGAGCPSVEQSPKKSNDRLDIAKDFLSKHQLEAAEAEANKALSFLATNDEAFYVRGAVNFVRAVDAKKQLEIDTCLTGIDAEAIARVMDERLAAANKDFVRSTQLAPTFGEGWAIQGVVANLQGAEDEAITFFGRALENPARLTNVGVTRANLGWAYFNKGDVVSAAKELLLAVQFQPGLCIATYRLGRVYFERKEWEKAAEQFQDVRDQPDCQAAEQRSLQQEARLYLMKTRIEQGLTADARAARDGCLSILSKSCFAAQCRSEGASLGSDAE